MNRRRQVIIYIIIIVALGLANMRFSDKYFTPEQVFYACERGLRYGPSEEIIAKYEKDPDNVVIFGRCGDGISTIQAKKTMFGFWKIADGMITGYVPFTDGKTTAVFYDRGLGDVYGITVNKDAKMISCDIGNQEKIIISDIKAEVDENGFFATEVQGSYDESYLYVMYTRELDKNGKIIKAGYNY